MQQQELKALLSDMSLEEKIGNCFSFPLTFLTATWLQALPGNWESPRMISVFPEAACPSPVRKGFMKFSRGISKNTRTISPCCSWRTSSTDTVPYSRFPLHRAVPSIPGWRKNALPSLPAKLPQPVCMSHFPLWRIWSGMPAGDGLWSPQERIHT